MLASWLLRAKMFLAGCWLFACVELTFCWLSAFVLCRPLAIGFLLVNLRLVFSCFSYSCLSACCPYADLFLLSCSALPVGVFLFSFWAVRFLLVRCVLPASFQESLGQARQQE